MAFREHPLDVTVRPSSWRTSQERDEYRSAISIWQGSSRLRITLDQVDKLIADIEEAEQRFADRAEARG